MKKVKNLRWYIIGLISLATVINYIDRSALAVMWPSISSDLGMDKKDYAVILNIFMISYAIGQAVTGKFFDKIGTRFGYVCTIILWGLSSFFHSMARGIISFGFLRSTLAIGEAGNWPGAAKSNKEWFPSNERATAQGLFNAGASIGSVIAPPLIAILWASFGWKITFMIVGSFGLVWVLPWLLINRGTPEKHPWMTETELTKITEGASKAAAVNDKALTLGQILAHREAWAVLIGRFFLEPIWWLFVGWMPIYLADKYKFNVMEIGLFAWVPYVGAAVGSIIGGAYAGKLIDGGKTVNRARKQTISIGGVVMFLGLVSVVLFGNTPINFVIIVAFVLFGFQFAIGNVQTLPSDLFSGKSVGSLAGIGGSVGVFSVIIMNFLVPKISAGGNYAPIFIMIAVFVPMGVLAVYFFARNIRQLS
ncbi:MAG: MFS transporter [Candidatus Marinimicrobia bacterium]|nr:MFS transporter [Candidatus Neomarinimicrobiota bacterium]